MKKFILGVCIIVLCLFIGFYAYYVMGMYVDVDPGAPVDRKSVV